MNCCNVHEVDIYAGSKHLRSVASKHKLTKTYGIEPYLEPSLKVDQLCGHALVPYKWIGPFGATLPLPTNISGREPVAAMTSHFLKVFTSASTFPFPHQGRP